MTTTPSPPHDGPPFPGPDRELPDPEPPGPDPDVPTGPAEAVAAGVLCWRPGRDGAGPEVLLVHHPGHQDWSWPKGEPERGEGLAECAVREAAQESGHRVVLGRRLPSVRHRLPDGRVEETTYWAARPARSHPRTAPTTEVDDVAWVPVEEAAARLSRPGDAAPLTALACHARAGTLDTSAVLVIRHATARPRDAWARPDAERPLVASGKRQAMSLGALLTCWRPEYLLSSPWRRCLETMDPYTAATGTRLRTKAGLSEAGHRRSPDKAGQHLRKLLDGSHGGALCTHRPVLPCVLEVLRDAAADDVRDEIPTANPYLKPGEVLVAHVRHRGSRPLVVAVERHLAAR